MRCSPFGALSIALPGWRDLVMDIETLAHRQTWGQQPLLSTEEPSSGSFGSAGAPGQLSWCGATAGTGAPPRP